MGFGVIDTSIMGMGRGAGNLKLEDFLKYKKKNTELKKGKYFFSKKFMKIFMKNTNGVKTSIIFTQLKNNIHPTFVQRFLEEEKFKKDRMIKILKFLKKIKLHSMI